MITADAGRRRWTADDRARIIEETLAPGAIVTHVARRHGLRPQQVFTWRRKARLLTEAAAPVFVPVVAAERRGTARHHEPKAPRERRAVLTRAPIELEVAGVTVRIAEGASAATIEAVVRALRAASA